MKHLHFPDGPHATETGTALHVPSHLQLPSLLTEQMPLQEMTPEPVLAVGPVEVPVDGPAELETLDDPVEGELPVDGALPDVALAPPAPPPPSGPSTNTFPPHAVKAKSSAKHGSARIIAGA
jgi:hypothetical protein